MSNKLNKKTEAISDKLANTFKNILNDKPVGIYIHGSLVMERYNPDVSDIDLLVVVSDHLSRDEKRKIINFTLKNYDEFPKNGLEMSIVIQEELKNFRYPTPFELHFSNDFIERYKIDKNYLCQNKTDKDLAAHFVVVKERGICLIGKPIKDVFYDIPKKYYLKSIINDSKWSINNILKGPDSGTCPVPIYGVLNLCRVHAFIKDKKIMSKCEGGEWGVNNLPSKYKDIIQKALNKYARNSKDNDVSAPTLKEFAIYSKSIFKKTKYYE